MKKKTAVALILAALLALQMPVMALAADSGNNGSGEYSVEYDGDGGEEKNGRLAMFSMFAFFVQAIVT